MSGTAGAHGAGWGGGHHGSHPTPSSPHSSPSPGGDGAAVPGLQRPPREVFFLGGGQCRTCSSSYFSQNLLVKGRQVRYSIQRQLMG